MSTHVQLAVPDLFLPRDIAAQACAGLRLPALETLLARALPELLPEQSLEAWLCRAFGVPGQGIAPLTLRADGMEPGVAYWLRADPVYLDIQRDQLILQAVIEAGAAEAAQLCASLNAHFSADGLRFVAAHAQRWYLQLDVPPAITTTSLSEVAGRNIHAHMPQGADALRWHRLMNEIQMLLFGHPVNQARVASGALPINSVWLWGGGHAPGKLARPFDAICGDSPLAAALAQAAGIPHAALPADAMQCVAGNAGDVLIIWAGLSRTISHGDLQAWRESLQHFEQRCAAPLLDALRSGKIGGITLDALQAGTAQRFVLTRSQSWKVWRLRRRLEHYSAQQETPAAVVSMRGR